LQKRGSLPPLVYIAVAWLAGLILAHYWLAPAGVLPLSLGLLGLIPLLAGVLWRKDAALRLSSVCALALLLGALRYQLALPDFDDPRFVAHYNDGGWVTVEGLVGQAPDVRDTWTNLYLRTEQISADGRQDDVQGTVLVRAPRFPEYRYGDRLRVAGRLETPPQFEDFDYRAYLAGQGVHALIRYPRIEHLASGQGNPFWSLLYSTKEAANEALARLIPEPSAALLQGILLGTRTGIPRDLYDDFNATGTSHVLVISGANITIVAALFSQVFGRLLGKRRAYWLTIAGITLYVLLVGADAVVIRAGIMGGLFVTALYLGRRATAYVSLLVTAVVLTLVSPLALWNVGFQLSFAATLSLILFTPGLERWFERGLARFTTPERAKQGVQALSEVLIVTLAAQILTLPLIVYHFGRVSLVAPLANLLILPVQMPIMIGGGLAAITGLLPALQPLAQVIAWLPWLFLAYTTAVVRWLARWPYASLEIERQSAAWLALVYLALLGLAWLLVRARRPGNPIHPPALSSKTTRLVLSLLVAAAILSGLALLQLPDGRLHVAFLDVGQGDAILITTPTGQQILLDGGPSPAALTTALGREMPFWDRSIDLLIMSHPDADHITGLVAVLERYQVAGWADSGYDDEDEIYARCLELLQEHQVPRYQIRAGDRFDLGQGIALEILHPPPELMSGSDSDSNNNSLVTRLVWREASFLLTGDLEAEGEGLLLRSGLPLEADVLKVAHHGSGGSSTTAFLSAVAPRYAVVSVGADNHFGHPAPATLERLEQQDPTILRTDEQGTVEFSTDGRQLWLRTER